MDCTFKTKEGKFNFRVAAIIKNGNKILMAHNPDDESCYYSVGGRVKMNETVEDAVIREVKEEMNIDVKIIDYVGMNNNEDCCEKIYHCKIIL